MYVASVCNVFTVWCGVCMCVKCDVLCMCGHGVCGYVCRACGIYVRCSMCVWCLWVCVGFMCLWV